MKERTEKDPELTRAMFLETLQELKKKGGGKYNFILRAGNSLLNALFKLYEVVWKVENIPTSWRNTTVIQTYKGRGDKKDMNFQRFLHIKKEYPKIFSHMVTKLIKPIIQENISPLKIGAIPGH